MSEREKTAAVIGGLGRMGNPTKRFFEEAGYFVIISDIKDTTTVSPREAIRKAGVIFLSVLPIENIEDIIKSNLEVFDATHRVLDNASLKNPLQKGYEMLDQKQVSICSTHPLCKEDQPLYGQNVLIAPFGQNPNEAIQVAKQVHEKAGMITIPIDFDKHDSTMLYNQLLPHLVNRAIENMLANSGIDVETLSAISTANSKLFSLANWRTSIQPPEISAMLIANSLQTPEGQRMLNALKDSIDTIEKHTMQPEELARIFKSDVKLLDPTGKIRKDMGETSTITLEHLANLAKCSFVVETHEKDRPGLLRDLLGVIKDNGINLNTVLSQRVDGGVKFHLGVESGQLTPEAVKELEDLAFHVSNMTSS